MFTALADPAGVSAHRVGAVERVALLLADWRQTQLRLADTEARMTSVLDELQLTALATSITGLSAIGAAAILAETGDPAGSPPPRWSNTRCWDQPHYGYAGTDDRRGVDPKRLTCNVLR